MKTYKKIASLFAAIENCKKTGHKEWQEKHESALADIEKNILPCGGGFDSGTIILYDESTPEKIVLGTSFHHMNDGGYYDGWTQHKITIKPSLLFDITITISGRDKNGIKDYMADCFHGVLMQEEKI